MVGGWVGSKSTVSFPQARGGSLVCVWVGQRVQIDYIIMCEHCGVCVCDLIIALYLQVQMSNEK